LRLDVYAPDSWEALNQTYQQALALGAVPHTVQCFHSASHGLWELSQQLVQLGPAKRLIVYQKSLGPLFEPVARQFSRDGLKVKALSDAEFFSGVWITPEILTDLLLAVYQMDEPVTGELFASSVVEERLKAAKVYRLMVSHSLHRFFGFAAPVPQTAQIYSLRRDRAMAVLGARMKPLPPIAASLPWPEVTLEQAREDLFGSLGQTKAIVAPAASATGSASSAFSVAGSAAAVGERRRELILEFERLLPSAAKPIWSVLDSGLASNFSRDSSHASADAVPCASSGDVSLPARRLFDRSLFCFEDVDGLSLATEIANSFGLPLPPPGAESMIETTSLCRWGDERIFSGLRDRGLSPEQLRGLVIIAVELLEQKGAAAVAQAVASAHQQVKQAQNF